MYLFLQCGNMEGVGWCWSGLYLTQRSHFSSRYYTRDKQHFKGLNLQPQRSWKTHLSVDGPRWDRDRTKNLDTLIPKVSILVAELAKIKPVEWQEKKPKALMVTAARKNTLAETDNFTPKNNRCLLFLWTLRDRIYQLHPLVCIWGKVATAQEQLSSAMTVTK